MPTTPAEVQSAIVNAVGGLLLAVVSAILGFHLGRPKEKSEINASNSDASESIAAAADVTTNTAIKLVRELQIRLDDEIEARKQLEKKYQTAIEEIQKHYENELKTLRQRVDILEQENARLKSARGGMLS